MANKRNLKKYIKYTCGDIAGECIFAKIYFTEDDLELLYKAFEKEGSEYTNQFPTPDNS